MSGKDKDAGGVAPGEKKPIGNFVLVPIPIELWKKALGDARSLEDRSKDPDDLVGCPYDPYHRVATSKMSGHLGKCRENYKRALAENGTPVLNLPCKWNYGHQVIAPELLVHEAGCGDRHDIPFHQSFFNAQCEDELGEYTLDKFKVPQEEEKKRGEGCFIEQFIGSDNRSAKPVSLEDMRRPKEAKERLEEKIQLAEEKAALAAKARADAIAKAAKRSSSGEASFEEEWWGDDGRPAWNGMDASYDPARPIAKYPLGLSKKERRLYDAWVTKWQENIRQQVDQRKANFLAKKMKGLGKQKKV